MRAEAKGPAPFAAGPLFRLERDVEVGLKPCGCAWLNLVTGRSGVTNATGFPVAKPPAREEDERWIRWSLPQHAPCGRAIR